MDSENVTADKLAKSARKSLSEYCSTECKAFCCRSGHLLLTAKEADGVMKVKKEDLQSMDLFQGKRYVLVLGQNGSCCPNLEKFKCIEHKNKDRPLACQEYPLFIRENKTIQVSNTCPAARENKLYPFLAKFKKMGYKIT